MIIKISYSGYRFPPEIIQQAIWLYVRFTLSFRDVENLLAERGILVSYEIVRRWVNHFGPMLAVDLRRRRSKPQTIWHLDEVYLKIDGRLVYLWRAVDAEGEVLDVLVQTRRNEWAAFKLMRELLKKYGFVPDKLVTDDLRSYGVAAGHLGIAKRHERGRWRNYNLRTIKKATPFSSDLFSTRHRPANLGFPRENAGYPSALRPSGPTGFFKSPQSTEPVSARRNRTSAACCGVTSLYGIVRAGLKSSRA